MGSVLVDPETEDDLASLNMMTFVSGWNKSFWVQELGKGQTSEVRRVGASLTIHCCADSISMLAARRLAHLGAGQTEPWSFRQFPLCKISL